MYGVGERKMKKYKNFILVAIFALAAIIVPNNVKAAQIDFNNMEVICQPTSLEKGEKSTCYVIGHMNGGEDKINGFKSVVYTNDNLILTDVLAEASSHNADAVKLDDTEKAAENQKLMSSGNTYITGTAEKGGYTCKLSEYNLADTKLDAATASNNQLITADNLNSSNCVLYYSKGTTSVFSKEVLHEFKNLSKVTTTASYGTDGAILGEYVVQLDPNKDYKAGSRCGDICVKVWAVPNGSYYSDGNTGNETGNKTIGNKCTEIHLKTGGGENVPSGAFASYAILAAGAFIAISAVAIAKKNNKLYKI